MSPAGLTIGIEEEYEFQVGATLLTDVRGALAVPVLSTPAMIAMMERTAASLVSERLEPGQATVGFHVNVKHVASAHRGATCTARARLTDVVEGRKLHFAVEVVDANGKTIGSGTHERRVVQGAGTGGSATKSSFPMAQEG